MTNAAWTGTVGELSARLKTDYDQLIVDIIIGHHAMTGERAGVEQRAAWRGSLHALASLLQNLHPELTIALEYRLPMSNERCDIIVLGRSEGQQPTAIVIELKGWRYARKASARQVEADGDLHQHPEQQTRGYIGKLTFSHSAAQLFDFIGCAWLYHLPAQALTFQHIPAFWRNEGSNLTDYIASQLVEPLTDEEVSAFIEGYYAQSPRLFESVERNYQSLRRGALDALLAAGYGPSEEQDRLLDELVEAVNNGDPVCYLVHGGPGSGKTYLAVLILLEVLRTIPGNQLRWQNRAALGYRNNRLLNTLRQMFARCEPGLDTVIRFFSTGRFGNGLAKGNPRSSSFQRFDVAIYDEAQRMSRANIPVALERSPVSIFFYDESQILNADEEGRPEQFEAQATSLGIPVEHRNLTGRYRVQGGVAYHEFAENLLAAPGTARLSTSLAYDLNVYPTIMDLLDNLRERAERPTTRVALAAAFTESPGDRARMTARSLENRRIGAPLYSGFDRYEGLGLDIYWLMDPQRQYPIFWDGGDSNKLTHCASIYGCQGFEADYVGVIWGRDLVLRDSKWVIGPNCEDTVGAQRSLKRLCEQAHRGNVEAREQALQLLINRYRIFLTRGIHGTLIYCEDDETADFLLHLLPMPS